jgi:two-component system LytT family sensor kinase
MNGSSTTLASPRWIWLAVPWLIIGVFDATQTVIVMHSEGMHHAWARLFVTLLLSWLPWVFATPLVMRLGSRYPPTRLLPLKTWLVHLSAAATLGLVSAAWRASLDMLLDPWTNPTKPGPYVRLWLYHYYNGLLAVALLYSSILLVRHLLDSKQRLALQQIHAAQLNEQLSKAQLKSLRQQIEPHFLFNTLNSIAGLVREERNDDAVGMIAALSDFLRGVIDNTNRHKVPLREEMKFVQKYLEIQNVRFADRLRVRMDVPEELLDAEVPSLTLQPMVENAIKHGISKRMHGGSIRISAARDNGMLILNVYNDGPRLPSNWNALKPGVGISNVRSRLRSLYGEAFGMSLQDHEPDGVQASISVPFVTAATIHSIGAEH